MCESGNNVAFEDPNYLKLASTPTVKGAAEAIRGHVHGAQTIPSPDVTAESAYAGQEGLLALATVMGAEIGEASQFASAVDQALAQADRQRLEADRSRMVAVSVASPDEPQAGKPKAKEGQGADAPVTEPTRNINISASLRASGRAVGGDTAVDGPPPPQSPAQEAALQDARKVQRVTAPEGLTLSTIKSAKEGWLGGNLGKEAEKPREKAVLLPAGSVSRTSPPPTPPRPTPAAGQAPAPRR